jgi:hypothetical protein
LPWCSAERIVIEKSVSLPVKNVTKSLPFVIQTFPIIVFILIDHRTPPK